MTGLEKYINEYARDMRDPNLTGFVNFEYKKKLYRALWAIEKELDRWDTPKFAGEEQWLESNQGVKSGV